jgi:hypothetical protein
MALVAALVTSFVLFSLLTIAVTACYKLHSQNRLMMKQLQERLDLERETK